jgi:phage pi2 protein 07
MAPLPWAQLDIAKAIILSARYVDDIVKCSIPLAWASSNGGWVSWTDARVADEWDHNEKATVPYVKKNISDVFVTRYETSISL